MSLFPWLSAQWAPHTTLLPSVTRELLSQADDTKETENQLEVMTSACLHEGRRIDDR